MPDDGFERMKAAGMVREGRTVGESLARIERQEAAPRSWAAPPMPSGEPFTCTLPWPVSVNSHTRHAILPMKGKHPFIEKTGRAYKLRDGFISRFLTDDAKEFRSAAIAAIGLVKPMYGDVAAEIVAHPPDRRRRDLDNLLKATLDALQHAGVLRDDTQIRRLSIEWGRIASGGAIIVRLTPMADAQPSLFKGDRS